MVAFLLGCSGYKPGTKADSGSIGPEVLGVASKARVIK